MWLHLLSFFGMLISHIIMFCITSFCLNWSQSVTSSQSPIKRQGTTSSNWDTLARFVPDVCDEALVNPSCCDSFYLWWRGCQRGSQVYYERYGFTFLIFNFCSFCRSEQESRPGRDWVPGILRPGQLRAGRREWGLGGVWRLRRLWGES